MMSGNTRDQRFVVRERFAQAAGMPSRASPRIAGPAPRQGSDFDFKPFKKMFYRSVVAFKRRRNGTEVRVWDEPEVQFATAYSGSRFRGTLLAAYAPTVSLRSRVECQHQFRKVHHWIARLQCFSVLRILRSFNTRLSSSPPMRYHPLLSEQCRDSPQQVIRECHSQ